MKKIGFIGLGIMGLPMAANLIKAGYDTYVVSRSRPPIEKAIALGAKEASSPKELAETADILLTCLPNPQAAVDVYEGSRGIIAGVSEGKIVVDTSTISPNQSRQLYKQIRERGGAFLDAPISGGAVRAQAGTLTIMCGGDRDAFEQAEEMLRVVGDYVVHVGDAGTGSVIKLINNMLVGINTVSLIEAYRIGQKAGIRPELLQDMMLHSSGYTRIMDVGFHEDDRGEVKPNINPRYLVKDLGLVLSYAKELGVSPDLDLAALTEKIVNTLE